MFGKKGPEPELAMRQLPVPRMTSQERGIELTLRYIERILGRPLSAMDADVLIILIKAANGEAEAVDQKTAEEEA